MAEEKKEQVNLLREKGTSLQAQEATNQENGQCLVVCTARKITGQITVQPLLVEVCRKFSHDNQLCHNHRKLGHPASRCRSQGCYKCKGRHHTSICDTEGNPVLTAFTPKSEEQTLSAIIPLQITYLDT